MCHKLGQLAQGGGRRRSQALRISQIRGEDSQDFARPEHGTRAGIKESLKFHLQVRRPPPPQMRAMTVNILAFFDYMW